METLEKRKTESQGTDPSKKPKRADDDTKLKKPPKEHFYKWFLAIQISNSATHMAMLKAQEIVLKNHPEFQGTAVPIAKAHITLFLFNLDKGEKVDGKMSLAIKTIRRAVYEWRQLNCGPITLKLDRVGHFGQRVLFVKPEPNNQPLNRLWQTLARHFHQNDLVPDDEFRCLEEFDPHVTLLKRSRVVRSKIKGCRADTLWTFATCTNTSISDNNKLSPSSSCH